MRIRFLLLAALVLGCYQTRPPDPPRISGPAWPQPGDTAAYEVCSSDSEANDVRYRVAWGADTSDWTGYVASSVPVLAKHAWTEPGEFVVRAQAGEEWGDRSHSGWSDPFLVRVLPEPGFPDSLLATVDFNTSVSDFVFSADGRYCYVLLPSDDSVVVLDVANRQVAGGFATGLVPNRASLGPDGSSLYVGCTGTVYVVRLSDFAVTARIPFSGMADAMTLDWSSGYLYVLDDYVRGFIWCIRTSDNVLACSVDVGPDIADIAVAPGRGQILLADLPNCRLEVRSTADFSVVTRLPVGSIPTDVEVTPDGSLAYVIGGEGFGAAVVRMADFTVRRLLPWEQVDGGLAATRDSRYVLLGAGPFDGIGVLSTADDSIVGSIGTQNSYILRASLDGRYLLSLVDDGAIAIIGFE